jgi:uncharacterized repeat protein (TIGR01451 family)
VAGGGETNTSNDTANDPTTILTLPDMTITKTHTGNFAQGQTGATYTITASNIGQSPTNATVTVTDTLPAGLTATAMSGSGWSCTLGTLTCTRSDALSGGSSYPAITLTVNVATNAPSSVTNTATVAGGGETNTSNNTANDPTTILTLPDMTITKTHTGNFAQGQTGATYTITASNIGPSPTNATVSVMDTPPAGLTATAMGGSGWSCALGTLTCTRSDALSGGSSYPAITLTVNVATNAAASVTNTATVAGGGETNTSNDTANDPTTILTLPDMTITKTHTGNFALGQTGATYTITASNIGQSPTNATVTVMDTLPAGLTATAMSGSGWSCTLGTLTCTRSDALSGGSSYPAITLTVNVAANAPSSFTNTATVAGGGETNTSNNTANDPTTIYQFPTADSVTPNAATGTNQTFALKYSVHDPGKDYTDLTWVYLRGNLEANGCEVRYSPGANGLYLMNDSGSGWLGPLAPGSTGTLSNSQCTVNGTGSSASGSGQTLTLNLSLSASATFVGTQQLNMAASDREGLKSGWQDLGTWAPGADTPPTADSVTPNPASGTNQTFVLEYSVHNGRGYGDLAGVYLRGNLEANGCMVRYSPGTNSLYLVNDSGSGWLGPLAPGSTGTLANSQCTVNGTGSSASGSGQTLTLNLSLSASATLVGTQTLYMAAADSDGSKSGWQQRGTWTPGADTPPTADSMTPNPAGGPNQTFTFEYSAHNGRGYADLNGAYVSFSGCEVRYYQPLNSLSLLNDAGTAFQGALTPGTSGTLSNSQCTVNGVGTSVSGSNQTLTLELSVSAAASFTGSKQVYMGVVDSEGSKSGWVKRGMWTP